MDLKLRTDRMHIDNQGVQHESSQPFYTAFVGASQTGISFTLQQERGVEVKGQFGIDDLSRCLIAFAAANPGAAEAIAYELLGEVGRSTRKRIMLDASRKGADE